MIRAVKVVTRANGQRPGVSRVMALDIFGLVWLWTFLEG
jgi:hypothetical protein